jgi:hypothetical protein
LIGNGDDSSQRLQPTETQAEFIKGREIAQVKVAGCFTWNIP